MAYIRSEKASDFLARYFEYNSGELHWKQRDPSEFCAVRWQTAEVRCAQWNKRFCGVRAFTSKDKDGYRTGSLFGQRFTLHRVVYMYFHSAWPAEIDHLNRNKDDNRIENLRPVTHAQNLSNRGVFANNKSGVTGVARRPDSPNSWRASIKRGGNNHYLGTFKSFDDAVAARQAAEIKFLDCQ